MDVQTYLDGLITSGDLPVNPEPQQVQSAIDAYNQAHNLSLGDEGYMIHPEVIPDVRDIDGRTVKGWRLRGTGAAFYDKPDYSKLHGAARLSRQLSASIFAPLKR